MKAYRTYEIIIIIAHIVGFLVGAGSTAIISSAKGLAPFNPVTFTLIELQSVATGYMCYIINYVLVKTPWYTYIFNSASSPIVFDGTLEDVKAYYRYLTDLLVKYDIERDYRDVKPF